MGTMSKYETSDGRRFELPDRLVSPYGRRLASAAIDRVPPFLIAGMWDNQAWSLLWIGVLAFNFVWLQGMFGATVGKMVMGLRRVEIWWDPNARMFLYCYPGIRTCWKHFLWTVPESVLFVFTWIIPLTNPRHLSFADGVTKTNVVLAHVTMSEVPIGGEKVW